MPTWAAPAMPKTVEEKAATVKTLRASLASAKSQRDSLGILYHIFDLSPRKDMDEVGHEIYNLATRMGVNESRLDIIRQLSATTKNVADVDRLIALAKEVPDSRDRQETLLFLQMNRALKASGTLTEADRHAEMARIISQFETDNNLTADEKVLGLYTLVVDLRYNGIEANGDMLFQYLEDLQKTIEESHFHTYVIANMVYAGAAIIYSNGGDPKRAIAADRRLMEVTEDLEKRYKDNGRKYRDFSIPVYVAYRRMLRSAEALTPKEIADIDAKVKVLASQNADVAQDLVDNPRYHWSYYMATGKYAEAIPYLKQDLGREKSLMLRKLMLSALQKAAMETGDQATLVSALKQYNEVLEQLNNNSAIQKYHELKVRYEVSNLEKENQQLELEKRKNEIGFTKNIMILVCLGFVVVAVALCIMLYFWSKHRTNTEQGRRLLDSLDSERDRMRDTEYFDYAAVPNPEEGRSLAGSRTETGVKQKADVTHLWEQMTNDILYISSVGRKDRQKHVTDTTLDRVMRVAEANITADIPHGVKLDVEYPEDDLKMHTDTECLVFVLTRILANAARYTREGKISLTASPDDEGKTVRFMITDTGEKIGPGKEHYLFENFVNSGILLEKKSTAGLFLLRLSDLLLKCDLKLDRTYTEGTRFILRVPVNMN